MTLFPKNVFHFLHVVMVKLNSTIKNFINALNIKSAKTINTLTLQSTYVKKQ